MKKFLLATACLTFLTSSAFAATSIPDNAVEFEGHHYALIDDVSVKWDDAKKEEENFLRDYVVEKGTKNSYWLGGCVNKIGMWSWVTGEKFKYTNWGAGQPDNYLGKEDVLMMYRNSNPMNESSSPQGAWNDIRRDGECNHEPFFGIKNIGLLCEWDS